MTDEFFYVQTSFSSNPKELLLIDRLTSEFKLASNEVNNKIFCFLRRIDLRIFFFKDDVITPVDSIRKPVCAIIGTIKLVSGSLRITIVS